jgi:sortase A
MTKKEAVKFVVVRSLGNFLLLFALYGVFMTFGPAISYEVKFRIAQARGIQFQVGNVQAVNQNTNEQTQQKPKEEPGFGDVLAGDTQQILIPKDTQFSIVIPKIGASSKIFPNVDPVNADEFLNILKNGVAHAKGTVFPGMQGTTYLFAHSADNWWNVGRYNAIFYLLKDLSEGDEIVVFFENKRFDYVVKKKTILDAADTSLLKGAHVSQEQLVLQTCWPPGTTWKRLYIIAEPKVQAN